MRSRICKTIVLPATAAELYEMYTDSRVHAAFTGAPAKVREEMDSPFEALGGLVTGTMMQAVRGRLIVQSWRTVNFGKGDPSSTLILSFTPEDGEGRIDLVHLDVPAAEIQSVSAGWDARYFEPWLDYLRNR